MIETGQKLGKRTATHFMVFACLFLIISTIAVFTVQALDSHLLNDGEIENITEHNTCSTITNTTGHNIFIPTKSAAEWTSFLNNMPSGVIPNSWASSSTARAVRLNGNTSYLSWTTPQSSTDVTKKTVSFWAKKSIISTGVSVLSDTPGGTNYTIGFHPDSPLGAFHINNRNASSGSAEFKMHDAYPANDPSSWAHYMVVLDTGNATEADRVILYKNGERITNMTNIVYAPQNFATTRIFVNGVTNYLGRYTGTGGYGDEIYVADVVHVDGQALAPADFGMYDCHGVWTPKDYAGTYGANGFHLKFEDSTDIGKDSSGNDNDWTVNNVTVSNLSQDLPVDDANNNVGNYATLNPWATSGTSLSNGNLRAAGDGGANWDQVIGTIAPKTGKFYAEYTIDVLSTQTRHAVGLWNPEYYPIQGTSSDLVGEANNDSWAISFAASNMIVRHNSVTVYSATDTHTLAANDTIMIAADLDNRKLWFGVNGNWLDGGDPSEGTGEHATLTDNIPLTYAVSLHTNAAGTFNFGQNDFSYDAPSGFQSLSTANLNDGEYISSGTYTGNGSADGPFVYTGASLRGVEIGGTFYRNDGSASSIIRFGANGFKLVSTTLNASSTSYSWTARIDQDFADNNRAVPSAADVGEETIARSLRFDGTSYLSRTFAVDGGDTWTYSAWVKKTSNGSMQIIFDSSHPFGFFTDDAVYMRTGGSDHVTDSSHTDPSSWMHVMLSSDNGVTTVSVNGVEQDWETSPTPTDFNNASLHSIGYNEGPNSSYFNGYMADVQFVDGQALSSSDFGEYDSNGIWTPKTYAGDFGANGFHLDFSDPVDVGWDVSGNDNHFTASNIVASASIVNDMPIDDLANDLGNYATLNPHSNDSFSAGTLSGGNLTTTASAGTGSYFFRESTIQLTSGKWYSEHTIKSAGDSFYPGYGVKEHNIDGTWGVTIFPTYSGNNIYVDGTPSYSVATSTVNDVIGVALNLDDEEVSFYKNGVLQQTVPYPVTDRAVIYVGERASSSSEMNFGQKEFAYAPPEGFKALSTANLPQGEYMSSGTYTGNGSTDGPFVYTGASLRAVDIGGTVYRNDSSSSGVISFGANGFKLLSTAQNTSSASYNWTASIDKDFADNNRATASGDAESGAEYAGRSLRLSDDSSTYLSRTYDADGDKTAFTFSTWVKRHTLGVRQDIWSFRQDVPLIFDANDKLRVFLFGGETMLTTATFKDPASWMHIVLDVDTSRDASERVRLFINGSRVTKFDTESQPSSGASANIYTVSREMYIGRVLLGSNYLDATIADVCYVDGQGLDASSFGELNDNGVWVPKDFAGTYGTNGFYLDFSDSIDIGGDKSGGNNHLTANNLVASEDRLKDLPFNNSEINIGNVMTLNPLLDGNSGGGKSMGTAVLREGNTQITAGSNPSSWDQVMGTMRITTPSYFEFDISSNTNPLFTGVCNTDFEPWDMTASSPSNTDCFTISTNNGNKINGAVTAYGSAATRYMCAVDPANGRIWWGDATTGTWFNSGDPVAGTNAAFTNLEAAVNLVVSMGYAQTANFYFPDDKWEQSAPTGFKALSTANLPAGQYASSGTYTGNGTADGPFVYTGASLRGVQIGGTLYRNDGSANGVVSFTANGFKLISTTQNTNAASYNWTASIDKDFAHNNRSTAAGESDSSAELAHSLRFNDLESTHLVRTPAITSNQKTWTWSGWVKRATLTDGNQYLFTSGADSNGNDGVVGLYFKPDDTLTVYLDGPSTNIVVSSSAKFNDPSAWYHIVFQVDATSNMTRVFVNNEEVLSAAPENTNYEINNTAYNVYVGGRSWGPAGQDGLNGYMYDVHYVDGEVIVPSQFAQYDSNGIWMPKDYAGNHGTNGFHLDFSNEIDMGWDSSAAGNHFTVNNIVTSEDRMKDVPVNDAANDMGNYAILNPLNWAQGTDGIFSEGNLRHKVTNVTGRATYSTIAIPPSGKWYFEATYDALNSNQGQPYLMLSAIDKSVGNIFGLGVENSGGYLYRSGSGNSAGYVSVSAGDRFGFAIDFDNNKAWLRKNGSWVGGGDPVAGTSADEPALANPGKPVLVWIQNRNGSQATLNFGQASFADTPPTGFKSLNTANLPEDSYVSSGSYTGNGNASGPFVYTGASLRGVEIDGTFYRNDGTDNGVVSFTASGFKLISTTHNTSATSYDWTASLDKDVALNNRVTVSGDQSTQIAGLAHSLRFNGTDKNLYRVPDTTGNRKTWTWSAWLKLGNMNGATLQPMGGGTDTDNHTRLLIDDNTHNGAFRIIHEDGNTKNIFLETERLYRDPTAWAHIVLEMDTTQASAANRVKLYMNGVSVPLTGTFPAQNKDTDLNLSGVDMALGGWYSGNFSFEGYMYDVHFVDGEALDASSFGQYDDDGIWMPKDYTGTYGTNGFRLNFSDTLDVGRDISGNDNHFTANNIAASEDRMNDAPIDDAANDLGNYATMSPVDGFTGGSLSEGNLKYTGPAGRTGVKGTIGVTSGKWVYEVTEWTSSTRFGWAKVTEDLSSWTDIGDDTNSVGLRPDSTQFRWNGTYDNAAAFTSGTDVLSVEFDLDNDQIEFFKNGVSIKSYTSMGLDTSVPWVPVIFDGQGTQATSGAINFGQTDFNYTPTSGFKALNTANLPEVSASLDELLVQAVDDETTIEASLAAKHSFSNYVEFYKNEEAAESAMWRFSHDPSNEYAIGNATGDGTTAYQARRAMSDSNSWYGFAINLDASKETAGGEQAHTNGANTTITHNLGVGTDAMIFLFPRAGGDAFYHHPYMTSGYLRTLNKIGPQVSSTAITNITDNSFDIGSAAATGTYDYLVIGKSDFFVLGEYTGNNNIDGPFAYHGGLFAMGWVHDYASLANTMMYSEARDLSNPFGKNFRMENNYDNPAGGEVFDSLTNGMKVRSTSGWGINSSGKHILFGTFIHPLGVAGEAQLRAR
jgi:hypothetical protein